MRTLNYITIVAITLLIAALGGFHDAEIIREGCLISGKAKLVGNFLEILIPATVIGILLHDIKKPLWPMIVMLGNVLLIWWMAHDIYINLAMGWPLEYIGIGRFDAWWGAAMVNSGWLSLGVRSFLLLIGSLTYFSLTKEE